MKTTTENIIRKIYKMQFVEFELKIKLANLFIYGNEITRKFINLFVNNFNQKVIKLEDKNFMERYMKKNTELAKNLAHKLKLEAKQILKNHNLKKSKEQRLKIKNLNLYKKHV